ncbi:MAG: 30S ribosomal protein S9 [Patescibacteria group bacterium]
MTPTQDKYFAAVGRRKTATARVRITPGAKTSFSINDRELASYFPTKELQMIVAQPFTTAKLTQKFKISVIVRGGGVSAQAVAVQHGISRALLEYDIELRKLLKAAGHLKRDPRAKERRKFGLKKARKSPQWSKR